LTVIHTRGNTDVTAERGAGNLSVTAGQGRIVNEQLYLQHKVLQCIASMYFKQTLFMREHNSKD